MEVVNLSELREIARETHRRKIVVKRNYKIVDKYLPTIRIE